MSAEERPPEERPAAFLALADEVEKIDPEAAEYMRIGDLVAIPTHDLYDVTEEIRTAFSWRHTSIDPRRWALIYALLHEKHQENIRKTIENLTSPPPTNSK
jgi:hypothetical protein